MVAIDANIRSPLPAHVPENLVVDFDAYRPPLAAGQAYHNAYETLFNDNVPDIFWSPYNGGHWVVRRREHLSEVFSDAARFTSARGLTAPLSETTTRLVPIASDPPEQGKYRVLFAPAFHAKALAEREKEARELAISLIEGFKARGRCEFVTEFAQHLPIKVFMGMVDLPEEDRLKLLPLANGMVDANSPPKEVVIGQIFEYVSKKVLERRENPGADLISKVATSKIDGELISIADAVSVCSLLLIGGLDTVASMTGFIMEFLARSPAHRHQLIDNPGLVPGAVEEFLRRFAMTNPGRVARYDQELHGVQIKEGDLLLLATPSGAVDPAEYEQPDVVDFTRKSPFNSTFGAGPHKCPGAMLARIELKILLEEWLTRIPDFEVDPNDRPRVRTGVNGSFEYLPLVWTPA